VEEGRGGRGRGREGGRARRRGRGECRWWAPGQAGVRAQVRAGGCEKQGVGRAVCCWCVGVGVVGGETGREARGREGRSECVVVVPGGGWPRSSSCGGPAGGGCKGGTHGGCVRGLFCVCVWWLVVGGVGCGVLVGLVEESNGLRHKLLRRSADKERASKSACHMEQLELPSKASW
jgi:hypothetical protein